MPIFEYRCADCGARFEKLVRSSDTDGPACPHCGQVHVEKELSVFAAHGSTQRESATMNGGCPAGMCRTPDICGRN